MRISDDLCTLINYEDDQYENATRQLFSLVALAGSDRPTVPMERAVALAIDHLRNGTADAASLDERCFVAALSTITEPTGPSWRLLTAAELEDFHGGGAVTEEALHLAIGVDAYEWLYGACGDPADEVGA